MKDKQLGSSRMAIDAGHQASADKSREMFRKKTQTRVQHSNIIRKKIGSFNMDGLYIMDSNLEGVLT